MKRSNNQRQMTAAKKNVSFMSTTNESGATAAILPHTIVESTQNRNQKLGQRNSIDGQQYLNATNFKYLKHVLLKFMTSTEEEVRIVICDDVENSFGSSYFERRSI